MGARPTTFTNDGLDFDLVDDGPLDGTPVVLLHGFPQTAACWSRVAPYLHERGFRTFAPSQRGYSPGARPRGRAAYRMSALTGDATALIDAVGAPVHLVGHDWGSVVAWSTAAARPDLVRTLTSVSVPHPMAFVRSMLSSRQALNSYYMALFQVPWAPESVLNRPQLLRWGLARSGLSEPGIEQVLREVVDTGAMTGALNWYRAMPFIDPRGAARRVAVPTTHVRGTRDRFVSGRSAELTAGYVTGPYRLVELDASHWIPEERPAELAEIIAERAGSAAP